MRLDDLNHTINSDHITLKATSKLPTQYGDYLVHVFEDYRANVEHVALVLGDVNAKNNVITRVHSECLTGDIFSSQRCDCGEQLKLAQSLIFKAQQGVIIYLRGQEGRGIGITNKILAYGLQDQGLDTVEANLKLSLPVDDRKYDAASEILRKLKVSSVALLTNNPEKITALLINKTVIDEVLPLETKVNQSNKFYLETKRLKLGHKISV